MKFSEYGVEYLYRTCADVILNRAGTGVCPMEQCVQNIDNPAEAIEAIKNMQIVLQMNKKSEAL